MKAQKINKQPVFNLIYSQAREWLWVFAFLFLCVTCHQIFVGSLQAQCKELSDRFVDLSQSYLGQVKQHELLKLKINSQSDPEWIEMVLKKTLGVVPEGQVKIYFDSEA